MSTYISIHNVERITVVNYYPKNSNSVELRIAQEGGESFRMSLFGLPEDRAIELVKALGDAETTVYSGGGFESLTEYLATKGVFDAIEGK